MKAKILYISESKKSATLSVERNLGPITQKVSGFVSLPEGHDYNVGQELEIPATKVSKEIRTTEDGKSFDWLVFE